MKELSVHGGLSIFSLSFNHKETKILSLWMSCGSES